jgi:DcuC family C4-dicarboxylate transporter
LELALWSWLKEKKMVLLVGLAIIVVAIVAILRGIDVRLALGLAGLALGIVGGKAMAIVRTFLVTLADEKFVVPICCAMGFAYVLRQTQCDQHLVHLLVRPLRRVRVLLIPGAVLVGFVVNIPVISQTSTAVTIGSVLIPLLLAARYSPVTVGAALLLGSSIGGELLNPGAPELRTIVEKSTQAAQALQLAITPPSGASCVARVFPLVLVHLGVATAIFWVLCSAAEKRSATVEVVPEGNDATDLPEGPFRINLLKALVPLVPLLLLFLFAPPLEAVPLPRGWFVENPADKNDLARFDSRLIGAAMLVGVAVAALVVRGAAWQSARTFFEGAGYAYTHIISLIVTASCFGEGVKQIGLAQVIGSVIEQVPGLLIPASGTLALGFAVLCGSGMASTQSLFGFFATPALEGDIDPAHVGAVVSLAAAAGRTMSPVAAVTLMCAALTHTSPVQLAKRVAVPLLGGIAVTIIVAVFLAATATVDFSP